MASDMAVAKRIEFLDLPSEIRNRVYDFAIQPARLSAYSILDAEYKQSASDYYTTVPGLLFACRQIYHETVAKFYSRATLAIRPEQSWPFDGRGRDGILQQYSKDHAFCPARHLQLIRSVHIFCNVLEPVGQTSFQALFHWLICNTAVGSMWLSRKTIQHWRHLPSLTDLADASYTSSKVAKDSRAVDMFARRICPRFQVYRSASTLADFRTTQQDLEIHSYRIDGSMNGLKLHFDPDQSFIGRDQGCTIKKNMILQNHARVADKVFVDPFLRDVHAAGSLGLFQSILILA